MQKKNQKNTTNFNAYKNNNKKNLCKVNIQKKYAK